MPTIRMQIACPKKDKEPVSRLLVDQSTAIKEAYGLRDFLAGCQRDFRQAGTVHPDPGILGQRILVGVGQRLVGATQF